MIVSARLVRLKRARPEETGFDLAAACREADIAGIRSDEDTWLGQLLRDTFDLYAPGGRSGRHARRRSKGEPDQRIPPLHGRLIYIHRDENDRERHVCYRALQHQNAIAFQLSPGRRSRPRASRRVSRPDLLLIRRGPMPGGAKTKQLSSTPSRRLGAY